METPETVQELYRDFLRSEISDILALRALAGVEISSIDSEQMPDVLKRGAIGLTIMDGKPELVERQISRWSVHFSRHIDRLLKVNDLISEYPAEEDRFVPMAYKTATTITGALSKSIMNKREDSQ